jgi:transcription initiation factor IIE alpha subunit
MLGFCVKCEVVSTFDDSCNLDDLACPHCGNWESLIETDNITNNVLPSSEPLHD